MLKFVSNKGGGQPVDIETAILACYAPDGGLYVPEALPTVTYEQLTQWKHLSYKDLAFEVLSLFIDRSIISAADLVSIIDAAYSTFEKDDVIPISKLSSRSDTYIMEFFYGSTLSFKDVGLAFLVNLVDYFLARKEERLSIIVATTGDTGPAAASYIAGKSTLDAWVLYPKGMITEEQERQMTTLHHRNVHPVGVYNCADGGDDLDLAISSLYDNREFKERVNLSSVNSINWGRIMIQTVHYFYGYLQIADSIGEELSMCVPSGAFGNLCAGGVARMMGLPVKYLIVANNKNDCLHRIFSKGIFSKKPIHETVSSAIDILIPMNFWRYLYFCVDQDATKISNWMEEFATTGRVDFDHETFSSYAHGFLSASVSDEATMETINDLYELESYLLDPHAAVAVTALEQMREVIGHHKVICLATAHPSKFPAVIETALNVDALPSEAKHPSIEAAKCLCQRGYTIDHKHLEGGLLHAISNHWEQSQ